MFLLGPQKDISFIKNIIKTFRSIFKKGTFLLIKSDFHYIGLNPYVSRRFPKHDSHGYLYSLPILWT